MAIAQKLAGYSLGAADLLRRAMGKKKKEILDKEYVPFSRRHAGAAATPTTAIKTLWDILVPFSDYAFNKAHTAGVRAGLLLDRLPQGQLPGRVHGRRCSPASATTRTSRRSTWPSAAAWASRCCRRTSTSRRPGSPRSARTSGSAWPRSATSAPTWSSRSCAARKEKGAFTDFYDFLRKVDAVVCNKKTVESLIKAGAFDSLGHTRKGLLAVHADAIDAFLDVKRNEAVGQFDLFGDAVRRRPESGSAGMAVTPPIPTGEWDKADLLDLRAGDARPLRLRPSAVRASSTCWPTAADMLDRRARRGGHGRRRPGASPSPASSPACSGGSPSRAGPGRRPRWRTWTARSRCCSSPTPTSWSGSTSPRTRSWSSRAGSTGATTSPG